MSLINSDEIYNKLLSFDTFSEQTNFLKQAGFTLQVIEKDSIPQKLKYVEPDKNSAYLYVRTTDECDLVIDDVLFDFGSH